VLVSGVNPTDWKSRSGAFGGALTEPTVPNHDGAGVVDKLGAGVVGFSVGDRVWVTLAGDGRPASGTAQEYTVVPAPCVFLLPEVADFALGASVGIPAVTAHRALTVGERRSSSLASWRLQRARRARCRRGRRFRKRSDPARPVGGGNRDRHGQRRREGEAHHCCRRSPCLQLRESDAAARIRHVASDGVDMIVEVAAGANAERDQAVPRGTISIYANDGGVPFNLDVGRNMRRCEARVPNSAEVKLGSLDPMKTNSRDRAGWNTRGATGGRARWTTT
jgi:NADPH2:quinone reductase